MGARAVVMATAITTLLLLPGAVGCWEQEESSRAAARDSARGAERKVPERVARKPGEQTATSQVADANPEFKELTHEGDSRSASLAELRQSLSELMQLALEVQECLMRFEAAAEQLEEPGAGNGDS
jgi:hypothetical protein